MVIGTGSTKRRVQVPWAAATRSKVGRSDSDKDRFRPAGKLGSKLGGLFAPGPRSFQSGCRDSDLTRAKLADCNVASWRLVVDVATMFREIVSLWSTVVLL
jgi:hypothetical protein